MIQMALHRWRGCTLTYQFQITVDVVRELPRKAPSSQRGNWIDLANLRPVFDAVALEDISLVDMIDEELVSITQLKTGRKIRIENEGELTKVLARIRSRVRRPGVRTLIVNEHGEAFTPGMFKKRFNKAREAAGVQFQLRDLRAKNATDTDDLALAQKRLAHASRAMTEHYVRQ